MWGIQKDRTVLKKGDIFEGWKFFNKLWYSQSPS